MARTHADAPHRPYGQAVDVGDLPRPCERQPRPRRNGGPPGHDIVDVCEHAGSNVPAAEPRNVFAPRRSDEVTVSLRVEPVTEAPAHRRVRPLRAEHRRDVVEPIGRGGSDLDARGSHGPDDTAPSDIALADGGG